MNAKMKAALDTSRAKYDEARKAADAGDKDKAAALLIEHKEAQAEFELEKQLFEAEKAMVPDFDDAEAKAKAGFEGKAENGYSILRKMLKGEDLSDKEAAMVVDGESGENFLIPEDVRLDIIQLRKQYKSAKELVTVIPTSSMSGSFNFEKGGVTGLQDFDDGEDVPGGDEPKFFKKPFRIAIKGKVLPVSNLLQQVEKAGLLAYLNTWFIRNAIFSENKAIFASLTEGRSPKAVKGLDQLRKAMNKDLDPSAKIGAKIVTNQTGLDQMDEEKDKNGRGLLQPDPTNATIMRYKGYEVVEYSDTELPNVDGKAPLFFGAIDAADYFMELMGLQIASSEHAFFTKNQTAIRVMEGFDNLQADIDSTLYCLYEPPATT